MAETPQAAPCSDCTRKSLELKECRRCLTEVCPRCRPAHQIPRKCKILENRRKLLLHTPQSEEMKRRLHEKGNVWKVAKVDMDAKMRSLESQHTVLLQEVKLRMIECKRAAQFMDDRVDIIGEGEVKDLSGWIRTSLEHIQGGSEGMIDQVEHVTNSLLDTMINLQGRLDENPEQQLGVVQKTIGQLDQCIRLMQGLDSDQDQVPIGGQETRDADTQTDTHGQENFTQTETHGQENFTQTETQVDENFTQTDTQEQEDFTQTDTQEQEDVAQPDIRGQDDQRGRHVGDGRFTARLLPWGLVGFLLVLLIALAVPISIQPRSGYLAPTRAGNELRAASDQAWTTETDVTSPETTTAQLSDQSSHEHMTQQDKLQRVKEGRFEDSEKPVDDKLGKRSEKSGFETEIETKPADKHVEAHGTSSERSSELEEKSVSVTKRTGINLGVDTKTAQTEVANQESVTETGQTDSHSFSGTLDDQTVANEDDSTPTPPTTTTQGVRGWLSLCSVVMILVLSLPTLTLVIRRLLKPTQDVYTQTYTERLHKDIQTETDTREIDTQTCIEHHNKFTETTPVVLVDAGTMWSWTNVTSVINVSELVADIRYISDTATCPVTGRVYVCGERDDDDRVVILVFDRNMNFITHVTTDIHTGLGLYFSFISVSPAGELLVTTGDSSQISFLGGDGGLVRRVDTGSRCRRCVSDGHRLYVCHPDRDCVTVLDDQGKKLRQIGCGELRFPWYLAIHQSRLYVSQAGTKSLHVYTTCGDPVRRISTAGLVTEIDPWGVHVDGWGHVLVTDEKNRCIHEFAQDGTWIHTLTDDRMTRPWGLTQTVAGDLVLMNNGDPASLLIFSS